MYRPGEHTITEPGGITNGAVKEDEREKVFGASANHTEHTQ